MWCKHQAQAQLFDVLQIIKSYIGVYWLYTAFCFHLAKPLLKYFIQYYSDLSSICCPAQLNPYPNNWKTSSTQRFKHLTWAHFQHKSGETSPGTMVRMLAEIINYGCKLLSSFSKISFHLNNFRSGNCWVRYKHMYTCIS